MIIKFTFFLNCIFLLFLANVGTYCQVVSTTDREQVERLLELPILENAGHIKTEMKRIGSPAIPVLVERINAKSEMPFTKKMFLMALVGELTDISCCAAVTELLKNESAHIRGSTLKLIAAKKDKNAIPKIIMLLDDKEAFTTEVRTDPYQEEEVSVSDVALVALSQITGIQIDENLDENTQVQFWKNGGIPRQRMSISQKCTIQLKISHFGKIVKKRN